MDQKSSTTLAEISDNSPVNEREKTPALFRIIDAFRQAAYLVNEDGSVLFSNKEAQRSFAEAPPWLGSVVKAPQSRHFKRICDICKVDHNRTECFLVLPRPLKSSFRERDGSAHFDAVLPPSLLRVSKLLMMGLSDKEIARCTELTLASVRTYTRRIYKKLNVAGRQELLALALLENDHMK